MRRLASLLGVAVMAATAVVIVGGSPASAACPAGNGTIPTTAAKAYSTPSVGGKMFYIDDRDWTDTDDSDGHAGGFWIYEESNGFAGLQRGGDQWVLASDPVNKIAVPYFEERKVTIPGAGPVPPTERTLFRGGFGGGNLAQSTGFHDDCVDKQPNGQPYPRQDKVWV